MSDESWSVYKAVRTPYSTTVWELTLQELTECPRCGARTVFIPFPAEGTSAAALEGRDPRDLPPLDAALFICGQPQCLSLYLILFNAERQEEFEALIPYLYEAGRRALDTQDEGPPDLA